MVPKRPTSFGRQSREFSISIREPYACWSSHRQRPYRGFSSTSGEVIGTPSSEGRNPRSSINSLLRRLKGHSLAKAPPLSQTRTRVAINYVESRKSHSVPGRKVSLQMSADRFSSDGAENVG